MTTIGNNEIDAPNAPSGVRVTMRKVESGHVLLGLTLADSVVSDFEWVDGDKFIVGIGADDDRGVILLQRDATGRDGLQKMHDDSYYLEVALGNVPGFVEPTEPSIFAKITKVENGGVHLTVLGEDATPFVTPDVWKLVADAVQQGNIAATFIRRLRIVQAGPNANPRDAARLATLEAAAPGIPDGTSFRVLPAASPDVRAG